MAPGYCPTCNNTGFIDCHCGGDLCVCGEEEIECPECGGGFFDDDEDDFEEELQVRDTSDELGQVLADALAKVSKESTR